MVSGKEDSLVAAREALERRDYGEATTRLQRYLTHHPGDSEAKLELGLAHLLAGEVTRFAQVHEDLRPSMDEGAATSPRAARLWQLHRSFFSKLARGAAVATLVAAPAVAPGCASQEADNVAPSTSTTESLPETESIAAPPATEPAAPTKAAQSRDEASSGATKSKSITKTVQGTEQLDQNAPPPPQGPTGTGGSGPGGVAVPALAPGSVVAPEEAPPDAGIQPASPPQRPNRPYSAHRYSGGVRPRD